MMLAVGSCSLTGIEYPGKGKSPICLPASIFEGMMNIKIQQARLNKAHKKIAKNLVDPFYLSEWMCDRSYPWIQASFIDFRLDVDLHEIEHKSDDEIYELIRNMLIVNLEDVLNGLKK